VAGRTASPWARHGVAVKCEKADGMREQGGDQDGCFIYTLVGNIATTDCISALGEERSKGPSLHLDAYRNSANMVAWMGISRTRLDWLVPRLLLAR
jgi:hypothetical protein